MTKFGETNRARPRPLPSLTHELRNPLSIIEFTAARALQNPETAPDVRERYLRTILHAVQHAHRMIDALIESAGDTPAALDLRLAAVPAAHLLTEARDAGELLALQASSTLEIAGGDGLPSVLADPERITQVFEHLIGNAATATPAGGRIVLAAAVDDGHVRFTVGDDRQVRLHDSARARALAGAADGRRHNLGLTMARRIVEAHRGHIWIDGDAERGALFVFTLPRA